MAQLRLKQNVSPGMTFTVPTGQEQVFVDAGIAERVEDATPPAATPPPAAPTPPPAPPTPNVPAQQDTKAGKSDTTPATPASPAQDRRTQR